MDPTLLIFAALATFICYRLYTVLGTKGGHEPEDAERYREAAMAQERARQGEEPTEPVMRGTPPVTSDWAKKVATYYPGFDEPQFIDGARQAYEMIVLAYAQGDLSEVQGFLARDVRDAFQGGIDTRQSVDQTMEVTFIGIEKVDVTDVDVSADTVRVTVAYQSDQVRVTKDAGGEVVDGDANRIDLVRDVWVYERPVDSTDPNWTLVTTTGG